MFNRIRGYSFFFCGLLYVGTNLVGVTNFKLLLAVVTFLVLIQCLPVIRGTTRIICISLFSAGSLLLFWSGASTAIWADAITKNGDILTLMLFVPLLSIPFRFPRYRRSLQLVLRKIVKSGNNSIYVFAHGISHAIGVIVNIACISITYYMLKAILDDKKELNMMARAAARGYTTTCFWSPNSGAVGLVLAYWGGSIVNIIPIGLPLAMVALVLGWIENKYLSNLLDVRDCEIRTAKEMAVSLDNVTDKQEEHNEHINADSDNGTGVKIINKQSKDFYWLVIAVTLLLGIVIFLDWKTSLGILVIVPIISLLYPFIWSVLAGEQRKHWLLFKNFINDSLSHMSNEVIIFLGAGFFAVAMANSNIGSYYPEIFTSVSDIPTLLVIIIIILVVSLSLIGFHPVLTITSILSSLNPQLVGLPSSLLSVMVLASWGLAVTCSPFSACSLGLSNITGIDPFIVGIRWQLIYTGLLFLSTLIYFNIILFCFY